MIDDLRTARRRSAMLAMAALLFGGGCARQVSLYSGEKLPPAQVAQLYCEQVYVQLVDEKPLTDQLSAFDRMNNTDASSIKKIDILPGIHRLTVNFRRDTAGGYSTGVNSFTLVHQFKAGNEYTFSLVEMNDGQRATWRPELVDKKTKAVLATHEIRPVPAPVSKAGFATVRGIAVSLEHTSTGREVVLMRRTKASEDWIAAYIKWREHPGFIGFQPHLPDEREKPVQTTRGYGLGFFDFINVAPGDYVVLFEDMYGFCFAPVKVSPGAPVVSGVTVIPRRELGNPPSTSQPPAPAVPPTRTDKPV